MRFSLSFLQTSKNYGRHITVVMITSGVMILVQISRDTFTLWVRQNHTIATEGIASSWLLMVHSLKAYKEEQMHSWLNLMMTAIVYGLRISEQLVTIMVTGCHTVDTEMFTYVVKRIQIEI